MAYYITKGQARLGVLVKEYMVGTFNQHTTWGNFYLKFNFHGTFIDQPAIGWAVPNLIVGYVGRVFKITAKIGNGS